MIVAEQIVRVFSTREGKVAALDHVDLHVAKGEFFVLLGPSGSGKTTLLRSIAGLEVPDSGEISLDGKLVFSSTKRVVIPPEKRRIGMVFQSYAIWPHMTVAENVGLPLRQGSMKVPYEQVSERVERALSLVGMSDLESRPAPLLSGGQQQRVALARALAVEPKVLLMDEPLSNLDALLRKQVRFEIKELVKRMGLTVLYVTHDQDEAMELADRVAVMHLGTVLQTGSPEDLYTRPTDPRVAEFFGEMNWLFGDSEIGGSIRVSSGALRPGNNSFVPGTRVRVGIRPEAIRLTVPSGVKAEGVLAGCVVSQTFMGERRSYLVQLGQDRLVVRTDPSLNLSGEVYVHFPSEHLRCFKEAEPFAP
jgi:iron(III) transport system ATP-binding protein